MKRLHVVSSVISAIIDGDAKYKPEREARLEVIRLLERGILGKIKVENFIRTERYEIAGITLVTKYYTPSGELKEAYLEDRKRDRSVFV